MSMSIHHYVGPFITFDRGSLDLSEVMEGERLYNPRGELCCHDKGIVYLAPNVAVEGISRDLGLSDEEVFAPPTKSDWAKLQSQEVWAFTAFLASELPLLRQAGVNNFKFGWGIIPGLF
jgi:hypothetical protein